MAFFRLKNYSLPLALILTIISSFPTSLFAQSVSEIATQSFFDGIKNIAAETCAGKNFYTYDAFLNAVDAYPTFGTSGSSDANKREIAAFFAHFAHETSSMCHIEEINKNDDYCDDDRIAEYPCTTGKQYYGRGPLQLTWNYNYGAAGQAIGFDGLNNPEIVATDVNTSFKASMWYWITNVHPVLNQGFGATIRAINGAMECNGGNTGQVQSRVQLYQQYCSGFGVDPGTNLSC